MKKVLGTFIGSMALMPILTHADSPYFSLQEGDGFKRFSVSVGALHVMPQGKAQPFKVNTAANEGITSAVGNVSIQAVQNNLDLDMGSNSTTAILRLLDGLGVDTLSANLSGSAEVYNLSSWNNPGTGLEAEDVTTLGIMTNYFFTDNISLEIKAGIPPTVDLKGKGRIYAPFSAQATPSIDLFPSIPGSIDLQSIDLKKDILVTDLGAQDKAASARAWTPAFEFQYHFGKTGVNKFRPYVGLGVMYAYFNELEMNKNVEQDLIKAGHMIANIKDGQAGKALEIGELPYGTSVPDNLKSNGSTPKVKLEATDVFAPVATAGFTYDFNDTWFAVGSVSYAHLKNETTITVSNAEHGTLITSKADIEVNPILAYAGIGMRF